MFDLGIFVLFPQGELNALIIPNQGQSSPGILQSSV